jgi:hypothetical protein
MPARGRLPRSPRATQVTHAAQVNGTAPAAGPNVSTVARRPDALREAGAGIRGDIQLRHAP